MLTVAALEPPHLRDASPHETQLSTGRPVSRSRSSTPSGTAKTKRESESPHSIGNDLPRGVKEELDYWEKLVFSFDMDRDSGSSGNWGTGQSDGASGQRNTRSSGMSSNSNTGGNTGSGRGTTSNTLPGGQAPLQPGQQNPYQLGQFPPPNPAIANPQISQMNQLAQLAHFSQMNAQLGLGLDMNTISQLAALGVLSPHPVQLPGSIPPHAQQQQPQNDALTSAIQQMQAQGLLPPPTGQGGNTFPGFPFPPQQQGAQSLYNQSPQMPPAIPWPSIRPQAAPGNPQLQAGGSSSQQGPSRHGNLPPLSLPGMFPPGPAGFGHPPPQNAVAGPSNLRRAGQGTSSVSSSPTTPRGGNLDDEIIQEEKRHRNTMASARFRAKKKHKTLNLEKSVVDLEGRAEDLEREAADLRRENGWLKEVLIMRGRRARGLTGPTDSLEGDEGEDDEEDEEEKEDENAGQSKPQGKGKGKEPDTGKS